jgi:hypothetical protein
MEQEVLLKWSLIIGIPLLMLIFYKFILRVFFGLVIVPEDKIGLVTKKFVLFGKQELPEGRIVATDGEAGFQAQTLPPGVSIIYYNTNRTNWFGIGKRWFRIRSGSCFGT